MGGPFGGIGLPFILLDAVAALSPGRTHGPRSEVAIADLRRTGRELVRCGTKLAF